MGFTIVVLVVLRMGQDYMLFWWVSVALILVMLAFGLAVYVATPWKYRNIILIVDVVSVLAVCWLMMLIMYWRSVWSFF